jgi:adenine-specific DNA-methyltransferase
MNKIEANDPEAQSADIVADNLTRLQSLFPEAFAEGKVRFDTLRQLLGGAVDEADEKYGLNWHGKRRARQMALTPSTGTLRPCPDESVDWDTTQNLMIEGDNLEVLKLLQKSYTSKVKLIYIDPPYNTGKDFVYPDDFRDGIANFLELTGQIEGGERLKANADTSGRFHTDWLSMMYPRLRLARNLMADDAVMVVSIDDNEVHNAKLMLDEIFGSENFLAEIVWEKMYTTKNDSSHFSQCHEYLLVYAKNYEICDIGLLPRTDEMDARYVNSDNDPRGPWKPIPLYAQGETKSGRYPVVSPNTGKEHLPPPDSHWRFSEAETIRMIADKQIYFGKDGTSQPNIKRYLTDVQQGAKAKTIWKHNEVGSNDSAKRELRDLYNGDSIPFSFPKPTSLIGQILQLTTKENDLILDFFAGSGTTGHAVFEKNLVDGGVRRFILVQLPEPLDSNVKEQNIAASFCSSNGLALNLAELTKDRLRRAQKKVRVENPMFSGDCGFRVFNLDASNIRSWNPNSENLAQTLLDHHEHILEGRTEADLVYELLLKLGLDLCVPIESRTVAGKTVGAVGGGVLMLCLAEKISAKEVEAVAAGIVSWHKELDPAGESTVVFRDSAFVDDVAKTNMAAILAQNGLENVRSL